MGAIGKFSNGSGPSADVACECTQTYCCISKFQCYEYIFSGTVGKPGAPKLVIEESGPFSHVASECRQIFHSINSFFNFTTIYIYNLVMEASGRGW